MPNLESQDVQLFVYFTWKTRNDSPLLGDEQIRQAAYSAIQTRLRSQLCRVLAICSTPCQIHLIARFPASMSIKTIVSVSREAAEQAIFRQQEILSGCPREVYSLWARDFIAHTVSAAEAAQPQTYLQQQIGNFHLALPESVELS
jgi:REP element-mobilizing transposase RayT